MRPPYFAVWPHWFGSSSATPASDSLQIRSSRNKASLCNRPTARSIAASKRLEHFSVIFPRSEREATQGKSLKNALQSALLCHSCQFINTLRNPIRDFCQQFQLQGSHRHFALHFERRCRILRSAQSVCPETLFTLLLLRLKRAKQRRIRWRRNSARLNGGTRHFLQHFAGLLQPGRIHPLRKIADLASARRCCSGLRRCFRQHFRQQGGRYIQIRNINSHKNSLILKKN